MYLIIIVLLIIVLYFLSSFNLGNFYKDKNTDTQYITIGNERIRFLQKGKGRDILLIHGTPGSIEDWNLVISELSKKYRVTTFDRLGHGYSTSNTYTYHIQENALLVKKLINQLGLEQPLIVGHSYGGSIVAFIAVHYELNTKLVIIDSPLYDYQPDFLFRLVSIPVIGKVLAFLSSFTIAKKQIKTGVSELLYTKNQQKIKEIITERQNIWKQPKVIYSKSKESVNYSKDLKLMCSQYKNIKSEITIITSKENLGTYTKDCKKFHSEVKNSKITILEGTGHYIQLEKAHEVISMINEIMN